MSHIKCPVCGKNSAKSTFDPLSIEEDLKQITYSGLGRGKGFAVTDETSILGDDTFSPMVAEKVISLSNMFIREKIVTWRDVFEQHGISIPTYNNNIIIQENNNLSNRISIIESNLRSEMFENIKLKEEKDKREKEVKIRNKIDKALLKIFILCGNRVITPENEEWSISIENIFDNFFNLFDILNLLDIELIDQLLSRVEIKYLIDEGWWNFLIKSVKNKPKPKSVTDLLLEFEFPRYGKYEVIRVNP